MKLVKLLGKFYLLDVNMTRVAKDLPENTLVFCLSETHTNDPKECIRRSTNSDNCYGCQPLIASDAKIDGNNIMNLIVENELEGTEWDIPVYMPDDEDDGELKVYMENDCCKIKI